MKNYDRYKRGVFPTGRPRIMNGSKKDHVEKAPTWCSVDLERREPSADRADEPQRKGGVLQVSR